MERHRIHRLRLDLEISSEAFAQFAEQLAATDPDWEHPSDGFASQLYRSAGPGIEVNGEARSLPPTANTASLGSLLLGRGNPGLQFGLNAIADESDDQQATIPSPTPIEPVEPREPGNWPTIEEDPLAAPSTGMGGERLKISLYELDRCTDDGLYGALIDSVTTVTRTLWDEGHLDEIYRTMLVLSEHAAGQSGCSASQILQAQSALDDLGRPECVAHIINLARDAPNGGVRPTQVLLQLGGESVYPLLDALDGESDAERTSQLAGMVIALGDHAVPALMETIRRRGGRIQLAVRLAGELQSPKLIPILKDVLMDSGPALRREAGRALVGIGNDEAFGVLVEALGHPGDELPRIAAVCLGVLRDEQAVKPLLRTLKRAYREKLPRLAEIAIHALGQLDTQNIAILDALAAVLEERAVLRKRRQRGAKIAALQVLGRFESLAAQQLIVDATRDPDAKVSDRAREILADPDRIRTR